MDDDNELSGMRESLIAEGADLAGVHMNRPAEEVMARGRTLRLRRRLLGGLSGVTAGSAAMALALTLPLGGAGFRQVHVNEAAWSVNTNQDGTVTLQVRKAADPVRLQAVLLQAGVPVMVGWGQSCVTPQRFVPLKSLVYRDVPPTVKTVYGRGRVAENWTTLTFTPALRPRNLTYYLGSRPGKAGSLRPLRITVTLIPSTWHLTCVKGPHAISSPHATGTGSPHPTATPRPHPSCSPRPHATPSPSGTSSPRATRTVRPHPAATANPSRTASPWPHPSCSPRPFASPSPSGTPGPYVSPSPRGAPPSSPAAG